MVAGARARSTQHSQREADCANDIPPLWHRFIMRLLLKVGQYPQAGSTGHRPPDPEYFYCGK
jgi:hypothetical protein